MGSLTVAVTGAAGFLGRTFTTVLRDDPRVTRVVAIDIVRGATEGVDWITADIRDPELVETLRDVDVVVHLAFVVLGDLTHAEDINVRGSGNVFQAAARAGCRRVVFASSVAAYGYGPPDRLLTEEDPLRPIEAFTYSRTKGAAERALDETEKSHPSLEVVRLRPAIILGPKTHDMLTLLATGRAVIRPGRRARGVQFVHIDDVVEAFRLATLGDASGAFNVAAPGVLSYRELAAFAGRKMVTVPAWVARLSARAAARFRPALGIDPGWVLIAQQPPFVSSARAERELGWRPRRNGREAFMEFLRATRAGDVTRPMVGQTPGRTLGRT